MEDDPFDAKAMQSESEFMRRLAKLVREYRDHMDTSLMAGDLERTLAALDEGLLEKEWPRIIPEPRGEGEVYLSPPPPPQSLPPIKLDDSRPVTAALEDRDHRIAQLEALVKEMYAKLNPK